MVGDIYIPYIYSYICTKPSTITLLPIHSASYLLIIRRFKHISVNSRDDQTMP